MRNFDPNTFGGGKAAEHLMDLLNQSGDISLRKKVTKSIGEYHSTMAEMIKLDNPYRSTVIFMMKEKWLARGVAMFNHHKLDEDSIIRSLFMNIITTITRKHIDQGDVLEKLRGTKSIKDILRELEYKQ